MGERRASAWPEGQTSIPVACHSAHVHFPELPLGNITAQVLPQAKGRARLCLRVAVTLWQLLAEKP